jgi:anaerobic selenocysteine-containing dehydrogenase
MSIESGIDRRTFLKGVSGTLAGAALYGMVPCQALAQMASGKGSPASGSTFTYQVCPRNCHDTCTLISEVVDGKIIRITGDPRNTFTAGAPCVKGQAYIPYVYSPDRVLHPMRQVGRKGAGNWERMSWDEALKYCADRLNRIVTEHGGEAILPYSYSGTLSLVNNYGAPPRFFNRVGASNLQRSICSAAGDAGFDLTYGTSSSFDPEIDYPKTKLFVAWGINHAATNVHALKLINQARERGGTLVEVNSIRTPTASQADLFLQPRPGTDATLAMGVINFLIANDLIDKPFIAQYAIGFDELAALARNFPLDKVARITGVPEADLVAFATLYGQTRPSIIRVGFGIQRNSNGGDIVRAISMLPALVGVVGKEGGGFFYINTYYWPFDYAKAGASHLGKPGRRTLNINQLGDILNGSLPEVKDKPVKALIVYNSNPMSVSPDVNRIRQGLQRDDLFTIVLDPFMTDTADYADVILPASTSFEYEDIQADYFAPYVRHNTPAIKPLGESRPNREIFFGLAKAMGFTDKEFDASDEDMLREGLKTSLPFMTGITYDRLKAEHWAKMPIGNPFSAGKYRTHSGKIELLSEEAEKKWRAPRLVGAQPTAESREASPELAAKYPFTLMTPAMALMLNSQWHNVKYIKERLPELVLYVHPEDAKRLSLNEGDDVEVFNDRGRVRMTVALSTMAMPGVLVSYKNFWIKYTKQKGTVNMLTSQRLTDMGRNSTFHTNLVQVRKVA